MPKDFDAHLTVVYPMIDVRGRAADRVLTWTHGQTLPRDRYRVVVAFDGADAAQEREVRPLLGPRDELLRMPRASEETLLNAAAARAGTPWLVFTEGHCMAEPGCLEAVAQWISANPTAEVGNFDVGHGDGYLLARLSRRWFNVIETRWRAPDEWPRLHHAGFAIRADVLAASGGFEEYGLFSPPLLSARLHAGGIRIEQVPGAAVLHVDDARSRIDPVFFERHFGHAPVWANQLRDQPHIAGRMARAVVAAAMAYPRRTAELAALFRLLAAAMVVGVTPRVALHRLAVALDELAVERLPLPAAWRWTRFLRVHGRVVRLAQLEWIGRRAARSAPPRTLDRWPVERLDPDTITAVHGLEEHGGRRFRHIALISL